MAEPIFSVTKEQYGSLVSLCEKFRDTASGIQTCDLTNLLEDIIGRDNDKLRAILSRWLETSEEEKTLLPFPSEIGIISVPEPATGNGGDLRVFSPNAPEKRTGEPSQAPAAKKIKAASSICLDEQTDRENIDQVSGSMEESEGESEPEKGKGKGRGRGKGKGRGRGRGRGKGRGGGRGEGKEGKEQKGEAGKGVKEKTRASPDSKTNKTPENKGARHGGSNAGMQGEGNERESEPAPGTKYNGSMRNVGGRIYGRSAKFPLEEPEVAFTNDVIFGTSKRFSRTITNWRVVDDQGQDRNILPRTSFNDHSKLYMIGVCGALSADTESGQRLALGWWLPDPDPEERKWKVAVEILWVRIPLTDFRPTPLRFREEDVTLMVAYGKKAQYVLQCPHPDYAYRWNRCSEHFDSHSSFKDVDLTGIMPSWVEHEWWVDITRERNLWAAKDPKVLQFKPPTLPLVDREVIKANVKLNYAEDELNRLTSLNLKDQQAIGALDSVRPTRGRNTAIERNRQVQVERLNAQIASRSDWVREAQNRVALRTKEMETALKAQQNKRAKLAKRAPPAREATSDEEEQAEDHDHDHDQEHDQDQDQDQDQDHHQDHHQDQDQDQDHHQDQDQDHHQDQEDGKLGVEQQSGVREDNVLPPAESPKSGDMDWSATSQRAASMSSGPAFAPQEADLSAPGYVFLPDIGDGMGSDALATEVFGKQFIFY